MKSTRRFFGLFLIVFACFSLVFQSVQAQSDEPLAIVMTADGPIMPPMLEYFKRGIETADRRNADVLIIQLNTPGGSIDTMSDIVEAIRKSKVPVVFYVSPKDAQAASAGAFITMAGHASVMAPRTVIGAASPIDSSGNDIQSTLETKIKEDLKAKARTLIENRGPEAVKLAEAMIDDAKAVTANEALDVNLIDAIADNVDDLLEALDGTTVQMEEGPLTLHIKSADIEPLDMSFIEGFLLLLTNPNITFLLTAIGIQAVLIEISSPGGWVAGFIGVVCITLATYGLGVLPVNWFGIIFLIVAFVLFILDINAPTHGALTTAGVASFIVGALVLFNSPGTPNFQRVSVPLVISTGIAIGLFFFAILIFALRALRVPVGSGIEPYIGKTGTATMAIGGSGGQVQLGSELWSAEKVDESDKIRKGDTVEVVEIKGLRLKVRKKK
jgi:membrane-bound serine protease (ClpP class)